MSEEEKAKPSRRKRGCLIFLGVAMVVLVIWLGPIVRDLYTHGFFEALKKEKKIGYQANREANLKAIYTALQLYHESEEKFPEENGWMDAISSYLKPSNMEKNDAAKKLIRPDLSGGKDAYGYAINDAAAGRYIDDIPEVAKIPLVFESKETGRNAHGNPAELAIPDAYSITAKGKIEKVKQQ